MRGKPCPNPMRPGMPGSAAEVLHKHVVLEVEGIDRMYLNVYVPRLQTVEGVLGFIRHHRGHKVPSTAMVEPITRAFVQAIEQFATDQQIPLVTFEKGERKDDVAARLRRTFKGEEGVVFIGKAQEKCRVYRTEKRYNANTRTKYAWIVKSTALVNHYYFYCVDRDFGPFFVKFCSYFPYNGKLCLNGHEYAKRQLERAGIPYKALDNGVLSCENPKRLQSICDGLSAARIDGLFRKWLARLPHPFTAPDRKAGYRYELSILQIELSLTQVLDRPVSGRIFFEQVIRENLDIGRPKQVQLIFNRWVTKRSPGTFRTRVITDGVIPSLHVDYKGTRIKQYHKEGQALRTETTINNTRDFYIGKSLSNLDKLRRIGFEANRRLLEIEKISHDCILTEEQLQTLNHSRQIGHQRVSALRFGDRNVHALCHAVLLFDSLPVGFSNLRLREHLAPLLGLSADQLKPGAMTYHLRRLRLHGIIERIPHTHRYRLTDFGLRVALFFTRTYDHLLRPGFAAVMPQLSDSRSSLRRSFDTVNREVERWILDAGMAA